MELHDDELDYIAEPAAGTLPVSRVDLKRGALRDIGGYRVSGNGGSQSVEIPPMPNISHASQRMAMRVLISVETPLRLPAYSLLKTCLLSCILYHVIRDSVASWQVATMPVSGSLAGLIWSDI